MAADGQFDKAEAEFEDHSASSYETYSDQRIKGTVPFASGEDGVNEFLRLSRSYFDTCIKIVRDSKKLSALTGDEDNPDYGFDQKLSQAQEKFSKYCEFSDDDSANFLVKVKKFSSVDLVGKAKSVQDQFKEEMTRIKLEPEIRRGIAEQKKKEEQAQKEAYENSAEYYVKRLCEHQQMVDFARKSIERENKAADLSGFVDKKKMYQTGKLITAYEEQIQRYQEELKSKFGKSWKKSDCEK